MKFNLSQIMHSAWALYRREGNTYTFSTCLKLAWGEAKHTKRYAFNLEAARASISLYLVKLGRLLKLGEGTDIHDEHKFQILKDALLQPCDAHGVAVMEGKMVGLCKYAVRAI